MKFEKNKLADADQGYFITTLPVLGKKRVVAAPEGSGPTLVFAPSDFEPQVITEGPGGCMGFAPLPGRDDAMLMITAFYPVFRSERAGIDLFQAVDGLAQPWKGKRIINLPFVHRITVIRDGDIGYLVAATVCGGKDFQDDWSKPGAVYVAKIPDNPEGPWKTDILLEHIHRNHGMTAGHLEGEPCVYVSGTEGLFALQPPEDPASEWRITSVLSHEISEIYFADLDGDGIDEIAAIEPFHGHTLSVYKQSDGIWVKIFSSALKFGHGLWAGNLEGQNVIIAGNRDGTKDLVCFRVISGDPFDMEMTVVDHGSGTTNMDVIRTPDGDVLVTSNPGHSEYARYRIVPEE